MAKIIPFKLNSSFREERLHESGYEKEEREAREFYALSEDERERAIDAKAAAILERSARKPAK
jgi:hypothetical protein